ncbi:EscU/YscU/HrcU family type III secretion system export apparatus switch protein [Anaeromyxobacter terrae]|uniref:EscU/YscU/HrcU family type III secretion system export apparatus switch protein n=1 Tax=Anaeromyxobacter terrae TaxID=2925406 RepID=UPI001F58B494|nr:EscU/YscU/HrcU family type III secretion system export apparatus switch protein [Anaeromyxobacter sp. SG22]
MSGHRTEAPTPKRLRDARRRGEVAQSRELTGAAALLGGLVALAATGGAIARELATLLRTQLASAADPAVVPAAALHAALVVVARLSLAPAAAAFGAAVLAGALQAVFTFAPGALVPRADRVSPLQGLRRLLSPASLLAVLLGLAKAAILLFIAAAWLRGAAPTLAGLARLDARALWAALPLLGGLAARLVLAYALIGLADLGLARLRHRRALRMTRDEVRREHKEEEGDPAHRSERRRLHRALVEAGAVSRATVVVVNPTHVAVALRHDRDGDDAPRIVAKGAGLAAARIRSAARRAGVPIVRNVPLARALHRLADVGDEIPEELYEAAAAVLAHLYGLTETP